MRSSPRPPAVPNADSTLRDSVARVTAHDTRSWGFVLARLRVAAGQSLAEQAAALGVTESALTFLAVARLPRPAHRSADLAAAATFVGIEADVLRRLLSGAAAETPGGARPDRK